MREIYEKVYRNRRFTYTENGKEYTDRAVVIKFNYASTEYPKQKVFHSLPQGGFFVLFFPLEAYFLLSGSSNFLKYFIF